MVAVVVAMVLVVVVIVIRRPLVVGVLEQTSVEPNIFAERSATNNTARIIHESPPNRLTTAQQSCQNNRTPNNHARITERSLNIHQKS